MSLADSEDWSPKHKQASKHLSVTWDIKLWSAANHSSPHRQQAARFPPLFILVLSATWAIAVHNLVLSTVTLFRRFIAHGLGKKGWNGSPFRTWQ